MVDARCLTVFSISAHTSQRTQAVQIVMGNWDETSLSPEGLRVNSILILFNFNQKTKSSKYETQENTAI